jgi:hypothetical protein
MTTQMITILATLAAALTFAAVFYLQPVLRFPEKGQRGYRRVISFCAGTAVAYVFVHLLPELGAASERVVRAGEELGLPFADLLVYAAALLGFMLFYGLEHMATGARLRRSGRDTSEPDGASEGLHLRTLTVSYALYVLVVCYVMAHTMEAGGGQLALFAAAMGLHFLGAGYGLRREGQGPYDRWGRRVLAAAAFAGWAAALLVPLGEHAGNILLGFVAGALIMNTATNELPGEKDGRFGAFLAGGAVYAAVLLLIAE